VGVSDEICPIQPGDLLTMAPTPGHAMRAEEAGGRQPVARPGTITGRLWERWSRARQVEVFVMFRDDFGWLEHKKSIDGRSGMIREEQGGSDDDPARSRHPVQGGASDLT